MHTGNAAKLGLSLALDYFGFDVMSRGRSMSMPSRRQARQHGQGQLREA
jgi:hypothetical protein